MAEGARVRVGIDVGGTKILLVAADDSGHRLEEHLATTGPQFTATHLDAAVRDFLERLGLPTASIGIAVPGLINTRTGRVEVSDVLPELGGWMPDGEIGAPTFLVNDIRAALAEASATTPSPAYAAIVMAGTAIGSAFTGESGVFAGATGWAGEVGSMPVPTPDGVRRLDELAGGAAIVERAAMPAADVLAAAENGDPRIQAIITEAGEALGLGLATLVNVVNPRALYIAGGTLRYPGYLDAALESARRLALPELWRGCTIARVQDERRVVALGALRLAAQRS